MESTRWPRLAPLALAVLAAGLLTGGAAAARDRDARWDPPPCTGTEAAGPPGDVTWYRLEPVIDGEGTLVATDLVVGTSGPEERRIALAPEAFASGPVGGVVVVGTDDGASSRLNIVDPARGCTTAVADEAAVIRSAVLAPDGRTLFEHRVDRSSRADLGVWRRTLAATGRAVGMGVRVLPGLAPDPVLGRTFATDLVLAEDGRLVASSCAERACRVRIVDADTGQVDLVRDTGMALGLAGGRVVARGACAGWPCPVISIDPQTGHRATLVEEAWAAALAGGGRVVFEAAEGRVASLVIATGRQTRPAAAGGIPLRGGSTALAGAATASGIVPLATGGRPGGATLRGFDATRGLAADLPEATR